MTTYFDIETTGLSPFKSHLVTIQVRRDGRTTVWRVWETPETTMIERLLAYFDGLPWSETIVGFNVMGFDLPFILGRLSVAKRQDESTHARLYRRKWFDLYHYLGADFRSADYWLARLGIPRSCPYTGKDVPGLFEKGEYVKIEEHAIDDLALCEVLHEKLAARKVSQV